MNKTTAFFVYHNFKYNCSGVTSLHVTLALVDTYPVGSKNRFTYHSEFNSIALHSQQKKHPHRLVRGIIYVGTRDCFVYLFWLFIYFVISFFFCVCVFSR